MKTRIDRIGKALGYFTQRRWLSGHLAKTALSANCICQMKFDESPFKGKTGLRSLINAAGYSLAGTIAAWRIESAFRQVVFMAVAGIGIAFAVSLPVWGRVAIVFAHLMCVIVELLDSGLEAAVDYTSLERHPLAKRAKDMSSAAQFFSLSNLVAIWD